ncbi:hypothetical protein NKG94_49690 [Micromonospora sp. M12]
MRVDLVRRPERVPDRRTRGLGALDRGRGDLLPENRRESGAQRRGGPARPDPVAHWKTEEARLTAGEALPGYRRVDISELNIFEGGASWECGWQNALGVPVHSFRLLTNTSAGRSYTVSWLTEEFDWQVNAAYLPMIRQSFSPAL